DGKNPAHGLQIGRIRAQAIDRLGGKRHHRSFAEQFHSFFDRFGHGLAISFSTSHARAASASEQIKKTSCTVPVPVYRHFNPAAVGYCTLKLGGVLPRRTLIRPGTIRLTCGHSAMIRLSSSSSPPTRPCWRLIRPNFIAAFYR